MCSRRRATDRALNHCRPPKDATVRGVSRNLAQPLLPNGRSVKRQILCELRSRRQAGSSLRGRTVVAPGCATVHNRARPHPPDPAPLRRFLSHPYAPLRAAVSLRSQRSQVRILLCVLTYRALLCGFFMRLASGVGSDAFARFRTAVAPLRATSRSHGGQLRASGLACARESRTEQEWRTRGVPECAPAWCFDGDCGRREEIAGSA
jgi:hypothetical protein